MTPLTAPTTSPTRSPETATLASAQFCATALEQLLAEGSAPLWEQQRRRVAFEHWQTMALPGRHDENWMRTDLRLFKPNAWGPRPLPAADAPLPEGLLLFAIANQTITTDDFFADKPQPAIASDLAGRMLTLDGHVRHEELDVSLAQQEFYLVRPIGFYAIIRMSLSHIGCQWSIPGPIGLLPCTPPSTALAPRSMCLPA